MNQTLTFQALIELPPGQKIPSTNTLYKIGHGRRKYLLKNPVIHEFQEIVTTLVKASELNAINDLAVAGVELMDVTCSLKSQFERRDCTNLVKSLEDAIASAIGVNDNRTLEFRIRKQPSSTDFESINIAVTVRLQ